MREVLLNSRWSVNVDGFEQAFTTDVPSSIYQTLLDNGEMDNPYWRDNEMKALPLMERDFEYILSFTADADILGAKYQVITFEGIDTVSEVYLNGEMLQSTDNMHRTYHMDVKGKLKAENILKVKLFSPTKYIKDALEQCYVDGSSDAMEGFPHLRKAHYMFGWDWGARLPDAGIWRDVKLYGCDDALLDSVLVLQNHSEDSVKLDMVPELRHADDDANYTYKVEVKDPNSNATTFDGLDHVEIKNPMLWWPRGYGDQPLYEVSVSLYNGDAELDTWTRRIGLRTLTMDTGKDQWGSQFAATVNGVSIFSMGGDYIPEDHILPYTTNEKTRILLEDCALANFNTVRIWGGGHYPSDYFFDVCDELGLIVWQDCMIACAICELTESFEATLRQELIDNVKRLRHHASLALWCGNNEMEWQVDFGLWKASKKQVGDYVEMYQYMFPKIIKQHDPQRFYWPSSPSSGGFFDEPNDPNRGDVHYWDVWHGCKPFSDYRNYHFRYASEFGFQSFPCMKTVKTFTEEEDRNPFSYVMEKHQRNQSANGRILTYLADNYLYPHTFESLLYASQLLQADAIKYGVEHWRRNRGRCMGAIYWQLNDCWPVTSWASIDYCGRWKALHYSVKRFFAPVLLSCCEEGTMTQGTNVNSEHPIKEQSARLSVANETMDAFTGTVKWALRNPKGEMVREGSETLTVPALTSVWMDKLDFSEVDRHNRYFSYALYDGDTLVSSSTVLFCQPKHFAFEDPNLRATVDGNTITVTADAFAKSVEIDCEDTDILLSDNYFDMNAGTVTVEVLRGEVGKLTLKSVYDIR